jgi:hypothetical protein
MVDAAELAVQRELTAAFIAANSVSLILIPQIEVVLPSGGVRLDDGSPRAEQTFRLIPMSHTDRPVRSQAGGTSTDEGVQRRYDYTLLGVWNSQMAENDWWVDDNDQKWVIDSIISFNGYERKAMITAFGRYPAHG